MLNKISNYIASAHNEVILWKKWDIKYKSPHHRDCFWRFFPFSHKYYFEANPSFCHEYKNLIDMQRYPLIMLRDGIIPLTSFFMENFSPPSNFQSIILVPKLFEGIVPKAWHKFVACYEFEYKKNDKEIEVTYVNGMGINYSFWKNQVSEVVTQLKAKIPQSSKVEFLLPVRERSVFVDVDETKYISELLREIYNQFGNDVIIHSSHEKIINMKFNKKSGFCDLVNAPYIIYDNYLHHLLASEGSEKLDRVDIANKSSLSYPLSLSHSIVISEITNNNNYFNDIAYKLKEKRVLSDFLNPRFHFEMKNFIKNNEIKF